ncbi:MAG: ABC transporter ATP-binding protein/permease [Bacillus sp. (in: Bacteria)]|nr:ABC transporter ATP-binding protein/permease [Bacillus sp. (in: firmicutes)]MCM1426698.1 ABC transporter ATP-binding protein/permease [Eubacterium sp.]
MSKKEWKDMSAFFFSLNDGHKDVLVSLVLLSILQGARPFIAVVLTGILVDAAYAGAPFTTLLTYAAIGICGTFLFSALEGVCVMFFNRKLEYMQEIQGLPLNRKSMAMEYEYLEDTKVNGMRQRVEKFGDWSLMAVMLSAANKLIRAAVSALVSVFVVIPMFIRSSHTVSEGFAGSWLMSFLFLAVTLLLIWLEFKAGAYFEKKAAEAGKQMTHAETRRSYYLNLLAGHETQKDVRTYKQQPLFEKEFEEITRRMKQAVDSMAHYNLLDMFTQQTVSAFAGFLVYIFAGTLAYLQIITIGGVVTYASSILKFTTAIGEFAYQMNDLRRNTMSAGDYVEYMALPQRRHQGTIPVEKRRDGRFQVDFEHVSFRYPGSDNYVIKDLNLSFEIGEKLAIVGKNGSGKTTFIKLLCRLYDVTEGCIKVNGIDIRKYDYEEYCDLFAVVFQDFQVFSFPLGENIASGSEVDAARAIDALNRAGLGERFQTLPNGLDTCVGKEFEESGVTFSGGEKQKIAIARAIYKDAPFVIMDEPTAALDPESECEVYAGFDKMVGSKTAIYISHRLASCRFCQDILVFDKGCVIQRGSHEELEKQDGLYRQLWEAQAQYYA